MTRKWLIPLVAAFVLALRPAPAVATFHLMKIVEVFAGTTSDPMAQYVMLQMYFPGQNLVGGHTITVYDTNGTALGTFTFGGDVANGANLATILIATADAETVFGVHADLTMDPIIPAAGGAVCYDTSPAVDCVAWGSFSAPSTLPLPPGPPFNAPTGLVPDMAMHRGLSPGGAVTAFVFAAPAPRNNAGQTGMLTETPTPTVEATPMVTPTPAGCAGDCDGNGTVSSDELITLARIALGDALPSACLHGIPNDEPVTIALIIRAVQSALSGCPPQ